MTLHIVADERPSLLMAGNNDEVYNKKPQRYAEDNVHHRHHHDKIRRCAMVNLKAK